MMRDIATELKEICSFSFSDYMSSKVQMTMILIVILYNKGKCIKLSERSVKSNW